MLQKKEYVFKNTFYQKYVTVYRDLQVPIKAHILYFHGGGLLYGNRNDLPANHIHTFTQAGFQILSFDYPLAPAADLQIILHDICTSINEVCQQLTKHQITPLPYFLFGRSAGAYLCMLAVTSNQLKVIPSGIISWYGYGFLCDNWFCTPNAYYCSLPPVSSSCLTHISKIPEATGSLDTHFSIYVYARQTGLWKNFFYQGREKLFYLKYSLRTYEKLPCPLFAAHCIGDADVPFEEFTQICNRFHPQRFIACGNTHDFDRDPQNPFTKQLLQETLTFLLKHTSVFR